MNTKRLTDLRTMLREVRDGKWRPTNARHTNLVGLPIDDPVLEDIHFDLENWINLPDEGDSNDNCGTTACAIGFVMLDDRFHEFQINERVAKEADGIDSLAPHYEKIAGYFGISERTSDMLIMDYHYNEEDGDTTDPAELISRLTRLLNKGEDALVTYVLSLQLDEL